MHLYPPLAPPKNGRAYEILLVCRVSDPRHGKQDIRSLGDQEVKLRDWIRDHGIEPANITVLAGTGSGEWLERAELRRLEDEIESRRLDLVVAEDLGRIVRRMFALDICESAEDCGVRLIAVNDNVDTGRHGWQDSSMIAAWHHERSNRDTSDRIKRTNRSRFLQGGCLRTPIFGYVKPQGAKSDGQMFKDPSAESIYREWFNMLDQGASYAEVADWLNGNRVPLPPGARSQQWTPGLVKVYTFNPLLKGVRVRNRYTTRRHNKTGKYRSVKAAPKDLLERAVPHLAFLDAAYYDRVIAKVKARNAKYVRAKDGQDPRKDIPKKRTRFPGQCVYCSCCGRMFVYGAHGQNDHLICDGARAYVCWNGASIDGPLAARKIASAVFAEIERIKEFDAALLVQVQAEAARCDTARISRLGEIERLLATTSNDLENVIKFIRRGDVSESLRDEIQCLEAEKRALLAEQKQLRETPASAIEIPTVETLKQLARGAFAELAQDSFEFARQMRRIIPRIVVYPVRHIDSNRICLRANFCLRLTNLLPDPRVQEALLQPMERILTVDLFDPPQSELFRQRVVSMRASGMIEAEVASILTLTVTATQRASAIQREMDRLGITDPYLLVTEPPANDGKFRRHRHPRFRFEPREDAGQF